MRPVQRIVLVALGVLCLAAPWAGAQCVFQNESFDTFTGTDLDVWVESTPSPAIDNDTTNAHSGDGYLIFNTPTVVSVEQPVVIPLAEVAEVTFFASPVGAGNAEVRVRVDGILIPFPGTRADIEARPPGVGVPGYRTAAISIDISDYADGQSHSIQIEGDAEAGSSILVDDVCLTLTDPSGGPGGTCEGNEAVDPSFEEGVPNLNWVTGAIANPLTEDPALARIGQWFARFVNDANALQQTITLATTDDYELRFYLQIVTPTTETGTLNFAVDGVVLRTWTGTAAELAAFSNYSEVTIDISAFADGAAHDFEFTSTGDLEFRVDDVCVVAVIPEPVTACPAGAVSLIVEGDFEPDTCPDPPAEDLVIAAWGGDPDGVITTCQAPPVDGNGGSPGFAHFVADDTLTQSPIVLSDDIGSAWISFWVRLPAEVIDGQTLKLFLVNDVTAESRQIWPNETLDAAGLTTYYNDTFGGADLNTYVNTVAIVSSLTADPTAHSLRFEQIGSAEWFVDDLCLFGGGGFCISGGSPIMTVTSSNVDAEADGDGDDFVGRGTTMLIELQYPSNVISVCAGGGQTFELETEAGIVFPLNPYLAFADPESGLIQFQVDVDSLSNIPPIDGTTEVLVDSAPLLDDFVIDLIPPIVGPFFADVDGTTPALVDVLDEPTLPGFIGTDFIDLSAFISDALTGAAGAATAGVPPVANPLQPGNFTYTPWTDTFTPDNRILTYDTRSGRFAKVFFNDAPPLRFSVLCQFYDPPALDETTGLIMQVSGFSTDQTAYDLTASVTPTAQPVPTDSTAAPAIQGTDALNGYDDNHATARWDDLSFLAPAATTQNSVHLNVRCTFHARDRAGNVRTPQEEVLDGVEFWWLNEARSRLTPDWSGIQPTPDSLYFDFAMDRTYEPSPLGAPLPIFNVRIWRSADQLGPYTDLGYIGWTPARRLTSAYFQDLLLANPTFGNSWFIVELIGADEAGNFEPQPTYDSSNPNINSGRNWQRFFLQSQEEALNTGASISFWWNYVAGPPTDPFFRPVPNTPAQFEQFFGPINIVPMPPDTANYRVEAEFDLRAIVDATVARDSLRILWEIEDEQSGQVRRGILSQLYQPTAKMVLPYQYVNDPTSNPQLTVMSPTDVYFGDPQLINVRYYTFRAVTQQVMPGEVPGDPNADVANQDPTPAVVRFKVVPGSVQQYLEDMSDPQDQPIKELQRIE